MTREDFESLSQTPSAVEDDPLVTEPICCLCGAVLEPWHEGATGYGHNPEPLADWPQRCCDDCNMTKVIPARIRRLHRA